MSIATQIPMSEWLAAGDEAIATAIDILAEQRKAIDEKR